MNTKPLKIFIFFFIFYFMSAPCTHAQTKIFESAIERTGTIELFTSEGCSSCPQADDWLNRLDKSKELWTRWIPIAFHVDYWDYLGWKDPWSSPEFSKRQRAYSSVWKSSSIYTPGMVLNGEEWRDWQRIKNLPDLSNSPKPGILKVEAIDTGDIYVVFNSEDIRKPEAHLLAHAAILGFDLVSNVKSGENSGSRLLHHFNVLQCAEASMKLSDGIFEGRFDLPGLSENKELRRAVVFWVSDGEDPTPIQATGGEW